MTFGNATIHGTIAASLKSKTYHFSSSLPGRSITRIRPKSFELATDIRFPLAMSQLVFFGVFKNSRAEDATGEEKNSESFLRSPTIVERRLRPSSAMAEGRVGRGRG